MAAKCWQRIGVELPLHALACLSSSSPTSPSPLSPPASFTECAVEGATFDMTPCWEAPDSTCTEACRTQLDKLSQPCLDRVASAVVDTGSVNATAKLNTTLAACNETFTYVAGALGAYGTLLLPLAVLAASMALTELLLH